MCGNEAKQKIATLIHCIDDEIHIHDFRMVAGPTHINVIFDVVVPFNYAHKEMLQAEIQRRLQMVNPHLYVVLTIEHSFV